MNKFNSLRTNARSLKNSIDNKINNQLTGNENISYNSYAECKQKNIYLDKHKSFSIFELPQLNGSYYDSTVYNDGFKRFTT